MGDVGNRGGRPQRAERADRRINAGHSRGLDAALTKTEASIRNLKTEQAYVFDKNGKLISSDSGKRFSVNFSNTKTSFKDAVITHNHPNVNERQGTLAARIGTPLSKNDIRTAVLKNASEIRAVTPNYTYSIKRPKNGWNMTKNMVRMVFESNSQRKSDWDKRIDNETERYAKKAGYSDYVRQNASKGQSLYKERKFQTMMGRLETGIANETIKYFAKQFGWNYTRKRIS